MFVHTRLMTIRELRGMVDVKSKKCVHEGCKIIPSCNDEGKSKSIFCSVHKEDGMVNVITYNYENYFVHYIRKMVWLI